MKKFIFLLLVSVQLTAFATTRGNDSTLSFLNCCSRKSLAPAGIMTDHVHERNRFGIAYSYMFMNMAGNQSTTNQVSDATVFNNYMMAPHTMSMQMHMLMPMYGITNNLTIMAMINYNVVNMNMHMAPTCSMMNMPGMAMADMSTMPTNSKTLGLGDTKLYLMYNLLNSCMQRLVIGLGASLPTGSIDKKGVTTQNNNDVLPYCMQLGTGTYNLLPSVVYVKETTYFVFGAALQANIKLGTNNRNYCLGNEYSVSPWLAYNATKWLAVSLRAEAYQAAAISGWDADINQSSGNDPSANVSNYGVQTRLNAFLGLNFYSPIKNLRGMRLLVEYGKPVYQNLQGMQMPVQNTLTARLQYNF